MPIYYKLHEIMGKRRINIQMIHEKTGLARSTISAIYNGNVSRIENYTLSKLCEFFNCQVGDIMEYVTDDEALMIIEKFHGYSRKNFNAYSDTPDEIPRITDTSLISEPEKE